ncbi:unnamed protein product, partial [Ectocarpus sp. 12 AP-2014]
MRHTAAYLSRLLSHRLPAGYETCIARVCVCVCERVFEHRGNSCATFSLSPPLPFKVTNASGTLTPAAYLLSLIKKQLSCAIRLQKHGLSKYLPTFEDCAVWTRSWFVQTFKTTLRILLPKTHLGPTCCGA